MSRSDTLVCSELTGELASCAAKAIRETFPFGFVGISLIPKGEILLCNGVTQMEARIKVMN